MDIRASSSIEATLSTTHLTFAASKQTGTFALQVWAALFHRLLDQVSWSRLKGSFNLRPLILMVKIMSYLTDQRGWDLLDIMDVVTLYAVTRGCLPIFAMSVPKSADLFGGL